MNATSRFPSSSRVVVIGGGVVGASIAYHLAHKGVETVLLERGSYTGGTTWHAAGLVAQLRSTENTTRLARYTHELYGGLEAETGQGISFNKPGSLSVAADNERFEELRRTAAMARRFGVEVETVSPKEAGDLWPGLETSDLVGAVYLPHDGAVSPVDVTNALLEGARRQGAKTFQQAAVTDLLLSDDGKRVRGVRTAEGDIEADTVVLAAGLWSRDFGARYGVTIPLQAAEHYYVVTEPIADLKKDLPILRDPGLCGYYKEDAGRLLVGLFEPGAKVWDPRSVAPDEEFITLDPDMEHMGHYIGEAFKRAPFLYDTPVRLWFDGPEAFTPDDAYIIGEAPTLDGMFVAAGFNSIGIQSAGGVGWVMADWIIDGQAPLDLNDVDIRRFEKFHANRRYLEDRTTETLGLLYAMHWPHRQKETSRGIRRSPLHDRLAAAGACFGETAGWERPNWFGEPGTTPEYEYSYGRQNWHENNAAEHRAVRETVGLFDQSSFAKFLLAGKDSAAVIDRVSANDMDVPVGKIVYTQWCNERGGIEADLTVTRLGDDLWSIVTGAGVRTRDFTWLKNAIGDANATLTDVTSSEAVLGVMGPNSRKLLSRLTETDFSNNAFPFGTAQEIELGMAMVRALRVTYVGELGWEIYVPTEFAVHVYDEIVAAGADLGLRHCGFHTLNSCRIEKGYRHWGHDIGPDDTPIEAGLSFAVAFDSSVDFIGKAALTEQRTATKTKRFLQFAVHDDAVLLHHNEPVFRDGAVVGHLTSGQWGHTIDAALGMGYVKSEGEQIDNAWIDVGTWEIDVAGTRHPAKASLRASYDPKSERTKM